MRSLFFITIFIGSFLVFLIQPMLSKILLPLVGGAPAIWISSILFFQLLLLGGYAYSAITSAFMRPRTQAILHTSLILIAIITYIPITLNAPFDFNEKQPEVWTIITLLFTVGMPYFLLTANATLIQRWYFSSFKSSPYFLFSISNIGSLLGLLSFPFLIEWLLPIKQQVDMWSYAFTALLILFIVITIKTYKADKISTNQEKEGLGKNIPVKNILLVVLLGFIPSSLFLSTSLYITTDIGSLPLLWVIPLAVYLLSFIIAFANNSQKYIDLFQKLHPYAIVVFLILATQKTVTSNLFYLFILIFNFICLFIISTSCHGRAANSKPKPEYLTSYYFWLSVGGALGGFFNVIAPYLFNSVAEHYIVILLSIAALPLKIKINIDWSKHFSDKQTAIKNIVTISIFVVMAIFVLMPTENKMSKVIFKDRNFFGIVTVKEVKIKEENKENGEITETYVRKFQHNTTLHGQQSLDEKNKLHVASYYTPIKNLLDILPGSFFEKPIGILGLGAGVASCLGKDGQELDFFEINQMVIDVAENPEYFTYTRDCKPKVNIIKGDGRFKIEEMEDYKYSLLMMDAFTSDAVPMHLMTKEAMAIYIKKVSQNDGIIAFNISNRHLDFSNILPKLADEIKWKAFLVEHEKNNDIDHDLKSRWMILIPNNSPWEHMLLNDFDEDIRHITPAPNTPLWTDDYSNILPILQ